jgi:hypothetical protein
VLAPFALLVPAWRRRRGDSSRAAEKQNSRL